MGLFGKPKFEKLRSRGDIEGFIRLFQEEGDDIKAKVVNILGDFNEPNSIKFLLDLCLDPQSPFREDAKRSLSKLDKKTQVGLLFEVICEGEESGLGSLSFRRDTALETLASLGAIDKIIEYYDKYLNAGDLRDGRFYCSNVQGILLNKAIELNDILLAKKILSTGYFADAYYHGLMIFNSLKFIKLNGTANDLVDILCKTSSFYLIKEACKALREKTHGREASEILNKIDERPNYWLCHMEELQNQIRIILACKT